jgi:hypothetical protein
MSDAGDQTYQRQAFFETDAVDQLMSMVLELAAEHWVLRERVFAIERAADELGLKLSAAVENYKFTDTEQATLGAMRKTMIDNLMRTLNREHRHTRPTLTP